MYLIFHFCLVNILPIVLHFRTLLSVQPHVSNNISNLTYTLGHYSIPLSSMTTVQLTTAIRDYISKVTCNMNTVRITIIMSSYVAMDRSSKRWTLFRYRKIKAFSERAKTLLYIMLHLRRREQSGSIWRLYLFPVCILAMMIQRDRTQHRMQIPELLRL